MKSTNKISVDRIKPCPFCGEVPYLEKVPLWTTHSNGVTHGYVGCFEFDIHCSNCGCRVKLGSNNTIYNSEKEARESAIKSWNRRADEV